MITQAELKALIIYFPKTGIFHWRVSRGFIRAGSIAGGRGDVCINANRYRKERLAWLYMTGHWRADVGFITEAQVGGNNYEFNNLRVPERTPNKDHVDIGCIVADDSYSVFVINKGKTIDLGMHDDIDTMLGVLKGHLCSK